MRNHDYDPEHPEVIRLRRLLSVAATAVSSAHELLRIVEAEHGYDDAEDMSADIEDSGTAGAVARARAALGAIKNAGIYYDSDFIKDFNRD